MATLSQLLPALAPSVRELAESPLAALVKTQFVHVQVAHLISLFLLGGSVIVLNLRLIGVGFQEAPSVLERSLRPILNLSVVGVLISGLLIGSANAMKLYQDAPFLVKMIALLAGLVITYGVTLPAARADGAVKRGGVGLLAAALLVWGVALFFFVSTPGSSPGVILVIFAAALILLLALSGRSRWLYLAGFALILAVHQVVTHVVITDPYDVVRLDPANKLFVSLEALWVLGFAAYYVASDARAPQASRLAKLMGCCAILIWVTVAAAGRWIAFG